jgi:uncharacterized protein (UPF0212 family)
MSIESDRISKLEARMEAVIKDIDDIKKDMSNVRDKISGLDALTIAVARIEKMLDKRKDYIYLTIGAVVSVLNILLLIYNTMRT